MARRRTSDYDNARRYTESPILGGIARNYHEYDVRDRQKAENCADAEVHALAAWGGGGKTPLKNLARNAVKGTGDMHVDAAPRGTARANGQRIAKQGLCRGDARHINLDWRG